jgi:hypothetical protein
MAGVLTAIAEIVAWISPASPARELFSAPFVPRASFRGPQPHAARLPPAFLPSMVVADDEEDWDKAWNQFSSNSGTKPESESPQPLESLPPADIPVNWDDAWMSGLRNGFKTDDAMGEKPASYSPLDQQKEEITKREDWSRPDDWDSGVEPDAWQDDLIIDDDPVVAVPEDKQDAPLHEQLMFLAGQRAKLAAETEAKESVKVDATEEDSKVSFQPILKPLVSALLAFMLSAFVYTARPTFAIAAPASLGAAVLTLYSAFGLVKFIIRALTVARVGLA